MREIRLSGLEGGGAVYPLSLPLLSASAINGAELSAIVEARKAGAISRESLLENLRRGDVLPDGRSVAQEKALLYRAK